MKRAGARLYEEQNISGGNTWEEGGPESPDKQPLKEEKPPILSRWKFITLHYYPIDYPSLLLASFQPLYALGLHWSHECTLHGQRF